MTSKKVLHSENIPGVGRIDLVNVTKTKPTKAELVAAVRAHAVANYNKDGWDFLVECWSDSDIEEYMGDAKTVRGAIRACKQTVSLLNERRSEARAESGEY